MSDVLHNAQSFEDIERLKKEIDETYRGVLELVIDLESPGNLDEVKALKQEVHRLSTELEETYRGVIELALTLKVMRKK